MLVMKFGGTSVANFEAITRTIFIIGGKLDKKPVVVVSALSMVTDLLYRISDAAASRNEAETRELLAFATPETTFEELYLHINRLIEEKGFVNLDFAGNLGHSIARRKDDRIYTERGNQARLGDVEHFTFEPHISLPGSKYGYKKENIYLFEDGVLKEL